MQEKTKTIQLWNDRYCVESCWPIMVKITISRTATDFKQLNNLASVISLWGHRWLKDENKHLERSVFLDTVLSCLLVAVYYIQERHQWGHLISFCQYDGSKCSSYTETLLVQIKCLIAHQQAGICSYGSQKASDCTACSVAKNRQKAVITCIFAVTVLDYACNHTSSPEVYH